ncbi:hypothetical protein [Brucella anthropi]|uniref:hypothetical protein n=1 Tax=Brucella anthropi TaxID=529 RepID=UPI003D966CEF
MPSKELTNAVILAITNAEREGINLPPLDHMDQMLLNDADYIRPQAQAAISTILAALQEPTEEMIEAGCDQYDFGDQITQGEILAKEWRAMLAASALGEQSE